MSNVPATRRWAIRLAAHAAKVMPASRAEWAKAIENELHIIPEDLNALRWALGSIFASYTERANIMINEKARISRPILSLEMLLCFVPITWLCLTVIWVAASGYMPAFDAVIFVSASAVGPIGLYVAFRRIVLDRASSRIALWSMGVLAGWTLLSYAMKLSLGYGAFNEWWREACLIAVLPVIGVAHLAFVIEKDAVR